MKTGARIKKVFKDQTQHLLSILKKKESSLTEIDFHSIRIAIKRIQALFNLVEESNPSFHQKKNFAPFKLIFEQAGQIRDKEVILSILHSHPYNASIEIFEFDLDHQIKKEKKQFFKLIKSSLLKNIKRNRSRVSGFIENINHKTAKKYLKKKSNAIHKVMLNDQVDPSNLHEIRKRIKDIYYVQKMIEPKNSQKTSTDKLQELLGQWHDGRVLLQELDEYLNSHPMSTKDKIPYDTLKTRVIRENEARFHLIMEQKPVLLQLFP